RARTCRSGARAATACGSRHGGELVAARAPLLQVLVVRPRTAFRRHPGDDLVGILDVAGLAVDAVGGVDLQPASDSPIGAGILDHLVHPGRAEALARVAVLDRAAL